ncbi:pyrroline-5-carboxylate reductase [Roseinatronobacter sp. S2]|uniref:pyrroline-5-carboxylate reductase n=1 Tax=Roseinatronobacter sp. S2 TaxID=3035471 RepID=UPI0024103566|nr:pyrroline-5-carboxylate reductase [Roseinatronobacter sp. S2]WFE73876.1 pyrroline-5-carboxylate reductase [Roseinatronobacter sp. S2]
MTLDRINTHGMVLMGCGKMGSALLAGWLAQGVPATSVHVVEPHPSDWLRASGVCLNEPLPDAPAVVVLAVKPQMMGNALPALQTFGNGKTLFLSIAAGTQLARFNEILGAQTPIIRAMPNIPAAVGQGISALIGNDKASEQDIALAEELLAAVGQTVRLEDESQIDSVTGLSGSGPAYVFHMIEAMARAGESQGLSPDLAMKLARATVIGAAALARDTTDSAEQLRINVTSPGGTTAAALALLMDETDGLPPLMVRAVRAAADRSRELAK